jgi:aminoglycoside phosphotransferase (APT) family kinase protein
MLNDDPALQDLEIAWRPQAMQRFLEERVAPALYPDRRLRAVRREHTRYSPGKRCAVLYNLTFDDGAPELATVTFGKRSWLERAGASHARPADGAPPRALLVPEQPCLVERFPLDWQLPGLAGAVDADEVRALARRLSYGGARDDAAPPRIELLRYVPHRRAVVAYRMAGRDLIGKLYGEEGKAADVWRKLSTAHAALDEDGAVVPRPVALIEAWNAVLMERVPGVPLKGLLRGAGASAPRVRGALRMAAVALARLHRVRIDGVEVRTAAGELRHLRKRAVRIQDVAPELAVELQALCDRLGPVVDALPLVEPVFIHDGYKPAQVLVQPERVSIIDFDGSCAGDPAADAGKFMAQLCKEALLSGREEIRGLRRDFLQAYLDASHARGVDERAPAWECVALLQIAVQRFRSKPAEYAKKGAQSMPARLAREAGRALDEL